MSLTLWIEHILAMICSCSVLTTIDWKTLLNESNIVYELVEDDRLDVDILLVRLLISDTIRTYDYGSDVYTET